MTGEEEKRGNDAMFPRNVVTYQLIAGISLVLVAVLFWPELAAAQSTTTPSPLLPASPNASLVAGLYWLVFWIAVVVFILVEGLLIYSVLRFRRRSDDELPTQVHGNTRMEIAWTVGPALIAVAIFGFSLQVMLADRPPDAEGVAAISVASVCFGSDVSADEVADFLAVSTLTVEVTGKQWWWEINYADYGFTTATDMYVPVGEVVVLQMTSQDVVHSWWIPQLGGKQDVYPNTTTYAWFQATEPGVYEGHCTELCGDSHAYMPMRVVALESSQFEQWASQQQTPVIEPGSPLAQQGAELMRTKGCVGCHSLRGVSEASRVGPNLTHMASRTQIAGMMPYSTENMRSWLADPSQKPGARMPDLNLTQEELDALVAYLDTLK
jgi:cytochrome c oxidase subunit 2